MQKKGYKHTNETKRKISEALKGKKLSEETRMKMSENNARFWKNKKLTEEHKKKLSLSLMGRKLSEEIKRKMSLAKGGTGIPQQIFKRYYHLRDRKYFEWRSKVFERDNWICQTCGLRGIKLEPHHIKGWAKYPELRYEVENGVALCIECHRLTRRKKLGKATQDYPAKK